MATIATDAHIIACCAAITALGAKITVHTASPGTTGANQVGTLNFTTVWGTPTVSGGVATSIGSAGTLNIPANTTVTHIGIWNGSTFLRGYPLDSSITVGAAGAVNVDFTPKTKCQPS